MLRDTILEIFDNTWPMLVIVLVILIVLRISYLKKNNIKLVLYKEIITLAFAIYILCLFHVVTFQDVNYANSNYIPFKEMFRYSFGSKLFFRNVLGNMLMFIPFGFFSSYILKEKKAIAPVLMSMLLSATIELTQLGIGRVFDVDDIILNIIGGYVGFYFYSFVIDIKDKLPVVLKKNWFYNIITLLCLCVMILYLFNIIRIGV